MQNMLSENPQASSSEQNSTPTRFQPPLRLRAIDRGQRELGVMREDHELYAMAAALYLAQPQLGRPPRAEEEDPLLAAGQWALAALLHETYTYLARNWPAERTRGPRADDGRNLAWRKPECVAAELSVTRKAAVDKVRAANRETERRLLDCVRTTAPESGGWMAALPEHEHVYLASAEEAMFEMDVDDPELILPEPDLKLLAAREIAAGCRAGDPPHAWLWRIPVFRKGDDDEAFRAALESP